MWAVAGREPRSVTEKDMEAQGASVGCGGRQPPEVHLEEIQEQTEPQHQDTGRSSREERQRPPARTWKVDLAQRWEDP